MAAIAAAIGLAAAGAATGITGSVLGNQAKEKAAKSANEANLGRLGRAQGLHREQRYIMEGRLEKAGSIIAGRTAEVREGFKQARSDIEGVGNEARQRTLDREEGAMASADQSLQRRGLYNSTVSDNAARGIRYDTNRALAEIDERIALLRSGVTERGTLAIAGALRDEAAFQQNAGAAINTILQQNVNTLVGVSDRADPQAGRFESDLGREIGSGLSTAGLLTAMYGGGGGDGAAAVGGGGGRNFIYEDEYVSNLTPIPGG